MNDPNTGGNTPYSKKPKIDRGTQNDQKQVDLFIHIKTNLPKYSRRKHSENNTENSTVFFQIQFLQNRSPHIGTADKDCLLCKNPKKDSSFIMPVFCERKYFFNFASGSRYMASFRYCQRTKQYTIALYGLIRHSEMHHVQKVSLGRDTVFNDDT